jgi:hypothetical protein
VGQILSSQFDIADCAEVWASRVAAAADLPDQRLNVRLADILTTFAQHPKDTIPQAAGDAHHAKSIYRFFQNRSFGYRSLADALARITAHVCERFDHIYCIHDSSSLNYSSLKCTTGLGRLGDSKDACGLILHSVLTLSPDGVVRGLVSVDLWHRPVDTRTKEQRYDRPFEEKESFKWVRGMRAVRAAFADAPVVNAAVADGAVADGAKANDPGARGPRRIHLMDREGDIHEVFADIIRHGEGAVIRCAQNRKVEGDIDRAHAAVAASPLRGKTKLKVRDKNGSTRTAILELRAQAVRLTPSQRDYPGREPLSLHLLEAREIETPAGKTPVRWLLWTTEAIATSKDLLQRLKEYTFRWRIEEYHLTLKSGCNTEGLLLETAERLNKAIVLYAAVATRIVTLRDLGRHAPDEPCTVLLSAEECRVLTARFGSKAAKAEGAPPPTIRQAMLWIGRLGGHLGRKSDGLPGVRTLWRGWRDLAIMVYGYQLSRTSPDA